MFLEVQQHIRALLQNRLTKNSPSIEGHFIREKLEQSFPYVPHEWITQLDSGYVVPEIWRIRQHGPFAAWMGLRSPHDGSPCE